MKVLPVKLPDDLYHDLKAVAKARNTSMAEIIRSATYLKIKKNAKKLTLKDSGNKKEKTFTEVMSKYIYKGKGYLLDKTDDEILYGGKLGDY